MTGAAADRRLIAVHGDTGLTSWVVNAYQPAATPNIDRTTLMITHNMRHALDHGDRLLMMDAGRIRLDLDAEARRELSVADLVRRFGEQSDHLAFQAV